MDQDKKNIMLVCAFWLPFNTGNYLSKYLIEEQNQKKSKAKKIIINFEMAFSGKPNVYMV